jgi:hypothetical protein
MAREQMTSPSQHQSNSRQQPAGATTYLKQGGGGRAGLPKSHPSFAFRLSCRANSTPLEG